MKAATNASWTIWCEKLKLCEIATAVENAKKAGLFVHTFWIAGFPGETRDDIEETMTFAASIGADSYSVSILSPLPGTLVYREVVEKQLWWPQVSGLENMTFRSSLIKVDGFDGPEAFESWVDTHNIRLNELLLKKDPERMDAYERLRDEALTGKHVHQT